jgi:hypothetical protein
MSNIKSVPEATERALLEAKMRLLAQLKLSNVSNEDAAKQLGITIYQVRKLEERDEFRDVIKELTEDMVKVAAQQWKGSVSKLIPKALSTLEKGLDQGKLDAVKIILTSIGLDKVEQTASGGTLQVILPDYNKGRDINVEVKE